MNKMLEHSESHAHQGIRELAPLLPRPVDAASGNHTAARALLDDDAATSPGDLPDIVEILVATGIASVIHSPCAGPTSS